MRKYTVGVGLFPFIDYLHSFGTVPEQTKFELQKRREEHLEEIFLPQPCPAKTKRRLFRNHKILQLL